MSLLPNNTYVNREKTLFVKEPFSLPSTLTVDAVNASTIISEVASISSIIGSSVLFETGFISTLATDLLTLDNANLTANGSELLLNGIPIATASNLSTLADWALDPAISSINVNGNDILNANEIYANVISTINVYANDYIGNTLNVNQAFISDLTVYAQTTENFASTVSIQSRDILCSTINVNDDLFADNCILSTINANQISTLSTIGGAGYFTNLYGSNVNALNVSSVNLQVANLSAGTINGTAYSGGSNWSLFPATQTVNMNGNNITGASNIGGVNVGLIATNDINMDATDFDLTVDGGINVADIAYVNITAENGNRGSINLTANSGFNNGVAGEIFLTANGGQIAGVGTGGTIELTANTPIGFSNLTSKISLSASGINSYAGVVPPIASLFGYNFIYGSLGVNICAGLPPIIPNVPGTTYVYGTNGVSIDGTNSCEVKNSGGFECGTGAYLNEIQPYWDGLTTPPDLDIHGRTVNFAQVAVNLSNVDDIFMETSRANSIQGLKSIVMSNGSISNVNAVNGTVGSIFQGIGTLTAVNINSVGVLSNQNITNTVALNMSSLNGYNINQLINPIVPPSTISTFVNLYTSTLNVSSINNFVSFGSSNVRIQGDEARLQLSNTAGNFGSLDLLMGQNFGSIKSYSSNFTPLDLRFDADNFAFNLNADSIVGGYEFDISGNTIVENGKLTVADRTNDGVEIHNSFIQISSIRQPVIQYGVEATTGGTGNQTITMPRPYVDSNSYVVNLTMADTNPAQVSYDIQDEQTFVMYWANAGGGNHKISWVSYGDLT